MTQMISVRGNFCSYFVLANVALLMRFVASQDEMIPSTVPFYTVLDDASWAVYNNTLRNDILGYDRQTVYNVFMDGCRTMAGPDRAPSVCDNDENFRMEMNYKQPSAVYNFTEIGFKKIRAPPAVMEVLEKFWLTNKDAAIIEWGKATPYHNTWESEPTIISIENENLEGGGYALRSKVANYVRDEIEKWTGMKQAISSVYGIRSYHNGSVLVPHVDRLPLVSSAILNVAQDVDEDWPLEVYDHNGVAHNVTMKPGDLVLYESHSIIHGRPFAMKGNFYANIFIHFEPLGTLNATVSPGSVHNDLRIPPYLIPNTPWEEQWRSSHPNGWNVLEDTSRLVTDGDLSTIKYAYQVHPTIWNGTEKWTPIHEAIRHVHTDIVRFLIDTVNVDLSIRSNDHGRRTPYELAIARLGVDHPITQLLQGKRELLEPNARELAQQPPVEEQVQHYLEEDGDGEYHGAEDEHQEDYYRNEEGEHYYDGEGDEHYIDGEEHYHDGEGQDHYHTDEDEGHYRNDEGEEYHDENYHDEEEVEEHRTEDEDGHFHNVEEDDNKPRVAGDEL